MSSELENAQRVLEQNEDILAAIVENLQLGRLNDCMQHYAILQANLVSLATHLDNFPADESDPYTKLDIFPDEIMRKDLLEDLRPSGSKPLPKAPNIPPCADCLIKKNSAMMCRGTLKHIEPSGKYSAIEREEFYNVTQVLSARPTPTKQDFAHSKRRNYKVWAPFEKYTLLVGISLFGTEISKLNQLFEDRHGDQIRNYINKKLKKGDKWIVHFNAVDLMNHRPNGYQPPPLLAPYFAAHALGLDPESVQAGGFVPPVVAESADPAATTATESLLAPEPGKPDFNLMLAIAAGVSTHNPSELTTRVPQLPEHSNGLEEDPSEDMVMVTEVPNNSSSRSASIATAGAATGVRPAIVYSSGSGSGNGRAGTASAVASPQVARRVHWDEAAAATQQQQRSNSDQNDDFTSYHSYDLPERPTINASPSTNLGPNLNMGNLLPSLRDPNVVNALPPLPSGPPATLKDPLKKNNGMNIPLNTADGTQSSSSLSYYAQQQLQADAAKLAQQQLEEEEMKQEKKRREESALLGLDSYNLEYARRLQAANIPFKMTSGSAVVVVKGDGIQTSTTANNPGCKNQPPPFARPGMQRLKKQQAAARQQELQQATRALPAPLQSSLLLQDPQQLMLQPQTLQSAPQLPMFAMHPLSAMPPVSYNSVINLHNLDSANNNINNNINNINYPNFTDTISKPASEKRHINHMTAGLYSELPQGTTSYPIQPSSSEELFLARMHEALKPRTNQSNNNNNNGNKSKSKSKASTNTGSQKQLLSQPITLHSDQQSNTSSSSNSSNNNESAEPSLFHHILSGTNINPPSHKSSQKNKSRNNTDAASNTIQAKASHSSAALDVSMSGYEEDANNSNLHSPPNMYSDQMIMATSDDLSGMQDFGCEFSFL